MRDVWLKGMAVPVEQQPPEVSALVLADHIHRDDSTGKLFLLGTRSTIGAPRLPWEHPRLAVYVALTDGRGETALRLRLVDGEEAREPVLEHETVVDFPEPTTEVEVVFLLTDLVFPEPGDYRLQLFGAGQFLRERRLLVIPLENPGAP